MSSPFFDQLQPNMEHNFNWKAFYFQQIKVLICCLCARLRSINDIVSRLGSVGMEAEHQPTHVWRRAHCGQESTQSHNKPELQGIGHDASGNYPKVIFDAATLWSSCCPLKYPLRGIWKGKHQFRVRAVALQSNTGRVHHHHNLRIPLCATFIINLCY